MRATTGTGDWRADGVTITAPDGWRWQPALPPFMLLLRLEGERDPGVFVPSASLIRAEAPREHNPQDQAAESAVGLRRALTDFQVLDWEPLDDGFRLLGSFRQGDQMLTIEQWARWHGRHAYVLSISVDSLEYGELAADGDAIAESLRFG